MSTGVALSSMPRTATKRNSSHGICRGTGRTHGDNGDLYSVFALCTWPFILMAFRKGMAFRRGLGMCTYQQGCM